MTYPINNAAMDGDEYNMHPGTLVVCMNGRHVTLGEIVKELQERRESLALAQAANEEQATLLTVAQFKAEQYKQLYTEAVQHHNRLRRDYNELVERTNNVFRYVQQVLPAPPAPPPPAPAAPGPVRRSVRRRVPMDRYTGVEFAYWE